jgi:hypothetical protein
MLFVLLEFGAPVPPANADIVISPHRAAYTLSLKGKARDSALANATGVMIYSWGETCDGWTVDQKFILNLLHGDGRSVQLNARSSTWESKDGKRFRFNIKQERDGVEVKKIRGEGLLDKANGGGFVEFKLPEVKTIPLPKGTVFPTMHTIKLLKLAEEGKMIDRQLLFDGSDLESPGPVSAFISPLKRPKTPNKALKAPLGRNELRTFNLAFFNADSKQTVPEFEMSIQLQDNGVAPSIVLDYGSYAVSAELVRIESLDKPDC